MYEKHTPKNCKVALIAGGTSGEREISLASKKGALSALIAAGYKVTELDTSNKEDLKNLIDGNFDVAFLCLHGKGGEDGTIQGFLELINLPYTGSGVLSSAISINKSKAKVFYKNHGIPTPDSVTIKQGETFDVEEITSKLGEKVVVKAVTEGSSLGVYIVQGKTDITQAIYDGLNIDKSVVVEQYIKGTELTVVVLGQGENAYALPIIEIIPKAETYDFDSKYLPGGSEHICPARLDDEITQKIQETAVKTHKVLECHGMSRTDFMLEEDGTFWVLETNTIPGMTETSLLPDAARAAGIEFPELCSILIDSALEKAAL